jgi:hypothetical protein
VFIDHFLTTGKVKCFVAAFLSKRLEENKQSPIYAANID